MSIVDSVRGSRWLGYSFALAHAILMGMVVRQDQAILLRAPEIPPLYGFRQILIDWPIVQLLSVTLGRFGIGYAHDNITDFARTDCLVLAFGSLYWYLLGLWTRTLIASAQRSLLWCRGLAGTNAQKLAIGLVSLIALGLALAVPFPFAVGSLAPLLLVASGFPIMLAGASVILWANKQT